MWASLSRATAQERRDIIFKINKNQQVWRFENRSKDYGVIKAVIVSVVIGTEGAAPKQLELLLKQLDINKITKIHILY